MLSVLNLKILRLGFESVEDFADFGLLGQILRIIVRIFTRKLQAPDGGARSTWWEKPFFEIGVTAQKSKF